MNDLNVFGLVGEIVDLGDASLFTKGDATRGPCDDGWEYIYDPELPGVCPLDDNH